MRKELVRSLEAKAGLINRLLDTDENIDKIKSMADSLVHCLSVGGKVLICGNGGSAADASHFAAELTGRYKKSRRPYPAIAFTDSVYLTAVANDFDNDTVFERLVDAYGKSEDVLICLSTSGNSENVIRAALRAEDLGLDVLCLTGKRGGVLTKHVNVSKCLVVDSSDTASIQEVHMAILHSLVEVIEKELE